MSDDSLIFLEPKAYLKKPMHCALTPRIISRQVTDHQLLVELVEVQDLLDGMLELMGAVTRKALLRKCLGKDFVPGQLSSSESEMILECLEKSKLKKKVRNRRSTFLEYIFINGAELDGLNNKVHELGTVLNANMRKI